MGAGEAERHARRLCIEAKGARRSRSSAERAVGGGGMPEAIVRWHHGHADVHGGLVAGDNGRDDRATDELAHLGEREHGRHDNRAGVQQRALVRVVEIGSVDERTVGEGCKRRIRARAAATPDGRDRSRGERLCEADDNAALVRIGIPCTDGAAHGIEYDIAGLGDDGRR